MIKANPWFRWPSQSSTERNQAIIFIYRYYTWIRQHLKRKDTGEALYQQCWEMVKDEISNQLTSLLLA